MAQPGSKEWDELHPDRPFLHQTGGYGQPTQDVKRFDWQPDQPGLDHPDGGKTVQSTVIEPVHVGPNPKPGQTLRENVEGIIEENMPEFKVVKIEKS